MITAFIKGQAIETVESVIVAESINYLKAQFVFVTNDWNGLEKTAYFRQGETKHPIKLDENNIAFPLHLSAGEWAVSVVGREYKNGELVERITTDSATINVRPFEEGKEIPFPDPAPTEIEALKAEIGNLPDLATNDKTSLVNAINEIYRKGGTNEGGNGSEDDTDLSNYFTKKEVENKLPYRNVKDFGAVGDGITDDTEAFQDAVDSGHSLFIPSGEYLVGNVYITKPVNIVGGGYPRLKFPINKYAVGNAYQPLSIFYLKGGTAEGEEGVNGVTIEGIHFDGNCKAITEAYYEAEGLTSPELMANVKTHSSGVIIRDRSKNVTIRDCRFDDFKDAGIAIEKCSKQVTVENCIIGEEGWHGYGYNKGIVASLTQYGGSAEIEDIQGYFIFRNNRIFNCGEHGINVYSSYNHCIIEGNFIKDCGLMHENPDPDITDGTLTWGYCIKTSGGADLLVANNTCICGMANGIGLMGDIEYGNTGDMRIIGNHIIGDDENENAKCSGIQCENVAGVIISENIIENIRIRAYAGVYAIRSTCGSLISNNIIKNCDRGIGINVIGDTSNYAETPNTQICNNTIIASQPLTLSMLNGANVSNNYIKGTEGVTSINGESVSGIIVADGKTVCINSNVLCDLPLGIKSIRMNDVTISETMFSNVMEEYDITTHENTNVVIHQIKAPKTYELIEEKTISYDDFSVSSSKPSNWDSNYKAYCINTGTDAEPIYTPVTDSTAPDWEADKYYLNGVSRINRTTEPDGTEYNFNKIIVTYDLSDKATVTGSVYTGVICDAVSKEILHSNGVTTGEKRNFHVVADISDGMLMPTGTNPTKGSTSIGIVGTPVPIPVSTKINRLLLQAMGSGFPVDSVIKIYGIRF